MTSTLVALDPRARRAWPGALRDLAYAPPGVVVVGLGGELLRVLEDGTVDQVLASGHPRGGIASDPCATRRRSLAACLRTKGTT